MMGHKICFYGEIWRIIPKLSLLPLLIWSTGKKILDFMISGSLFGHLILVQMNMCFTDKKENLFQNYYERKNLYHLVSDFAASV